MKLYLEKGKHIDVNFWSFLKFHLLAWGLILFVLYVLLFLIELGGAS